MTMFSSFWMANAGADTFSVDNSAMFDFASAQYLVRTPTTAGNRTTWTWSGWVKRAGLGNPGGPNTSHELFGVGSGSRLRFTSGDNLRLESPSGNHTFITTQVFRDPHAWYHIVLAFDSTQATDTNRRKLYVNGSQVTDFSSTTFTELGQNDEWNINSTSEHQIAKSNLADYFGGYLAEVVLVDGSALGPTSFGETDDNGVWRPIEIKSEDFLNYSTTDETTGASATASGGASDAGKAIDDNASTQWSEGSAATSAGATWTVTFSSAKHIRKITQVVASGNNVATGQKLQYYNGSTFVDAGAFTMVADSTKQTFFFDESAASTQWRLISTTAVGNPYSWCLNEVEMFEVSNGLGTNGFFLPFTNSVELGLGGAPSSSTAATVTFVAATTNSATASSYTFSSQSLSTAATGRIIAVVVAAERTSSGARTVSSLTVAGTSAALVVRQTSDNGDAFEIWEAAVASGTSGDIVLNFSASMDSCGIGVYAVYNARYQEHFTIKAEGTSLSDTLVIPDNSIAIGGGHSTASSATGTFVGLTENYDEVIDAHISHAGASTSTASSAGGGTTVSYTSSSPNADDTLIAATWFPSDGPKNYLGVNSPTQTSDSPTKNYAVLSPLSLQANIALSEGNLKQVSSSNSQGMSLSSFPVTTGQKVYIEATLTNTGGETGCLKATAITAGNPSKTFDDLTSGDARLLNVNNGNVFNSDGGTSVTNYAPDQTNPTTHMIALDLVNDKIYWGDASVGSSGWSNGSGSYNQAFSSAVGVDLDANLDWFFAFKGYNATIAVNFGQTAFTVSPPTGYSSGYSAAIENENRETALTIPDGSAYFQTTLYTGNGSTQTITQSGNSTFQPDMIWEKQRNGGQENTIFDAVRGTTKYIQPDNAGAEGTQSGVTAFNSNGFDLGSWAVLNENTKLHVAWQWLAGNSTASNSNGSITSTVSVNQTAGFSIVTWTGTGANATVGHGLGVSPSWILVKQRTDADSWTVYHAGNTSAPETEGLTLDTDAATQDAATFWNDTAPTSTVFSLGSGGRTNGSSDSLVAYCWCEKPGFSKFGSFQGNGNANGPVISLGFRPAWIMVKGTSSSRPWVIHDSARNPSNVTDLNLLADATTAEASSNLWDFLSNGFKVRDSLAGDNSNNQTYVYMAFAENPFAGTTPVTAR